MVNTKLYKALFSSFQHLKGVFLEKGEGNISKDGKGLHIVTHLRQEQQY